jgi:preprotein translocase subunit SecG
MFNLIITVHIVACFSIILIVLLQAGKGAEMGAAFGGASQTIFGSSGPGNFLEKLTAVIAVIFMLTSFTLAYFSSERPSSSVIQEDSIPVEKNAPLIPTSEEEK